MRLFHILGYFGRLIAYKIPNVLFLKDEFTVPSFPTSQKSGPMVDGDSLVGRGELHHQPSEALSHYTGQICLYN